MAGFIGTSLRFTPLVVRHPAVRRRSRPPPSSSSPLLVSLSDRTTIGAFAYGALAVLSSAALPAAALSPLPLPMMGGGTSPPMRSPPPHSRAIASKILPEMSYTTSTSRPPPRSPLPLVLLKMDFANKSKFVPKMDHTIKSKFVPKDFTNMMYCTYNMMF